MAKNKPEGEEEEGKLFIPRLITGGKDGDGEKFGGPNWLRELPVGSVFYIQDKQANSVRDDKFFNLMQLMVLHKSPNKEAVLLINALNEQQPPWPVHSANFSTRWRCVDVLHFGDGKTIVKVVPNTEAPEGDTEDGNREGTVQQG